VAYRKGIEIIKRSAGGRESLVNNVPYHLDVPSRGEFWHNTTVLPV
jgi:hypothetical protein